MSGFDLDRIGGRVALGELVDEVLAAGEEALRLFRGGAGARFETKPDATPVTEADRAVEKRLRAFCARRFPEAAFVGEEEGASGGGTQGLRFIVDPIDGTRPFTRGIPTWSVLVGLEADGEPAVGIAFLPAAGDLFVGVRGDGAQGNGRPLRLSSVSSLEGATVCHGALEQVVDAGLIPVLEPLVRRTFAQRGFHDFDGYRQLLLGRADAMIDPVVAPWDICAAAVLVREAGGRLTALDGTDTVFGGNALATNGAIHDDLLELLRRRPES